MYDSTSKPTPYFINTNNQVIGPMSYYFPATSDGWDAIKSASLKLDLVEINKLVVVNSDNVSMLQSLRGVLGNLTRSH